MKKIEKRTRTKITRNELEGYRSIIERVKTDPKIRKAKPSSGVIILSLVSDTYNIYNVFYKILPELAKEFIGWTNDEGIPLKIVVRPDSGVPSNVLFGYNKVVKQFTTDVDVLEEAPLDLIMRVAKDMEIPPEVANVIVTKGIFQIAFDKFGFTVNSKGYKCLHPQIGILQGDGVKYSVIAEIYKIMTHPAVMIDIMMLVFGSGGKNLQAHDRDEQKYAIKATEVETLEGEIIPIEKNPITDPGKRSKKGDLKLVKKQITDDASKDWMNYITMQEGEEGFEEAINVLIPVFEMGEILVEYSFDEIRENNKIVIGSPALVGANV